MSDDEMVPKAGGISPTIAFFEGSNDPLILLSFLTGEEPVRVIMATEDIEDFIPVLISSVVKARTIIEMITIYPDKRDEILKNVSFRWTEEVTTVDDESDGAA